MISFYSIVKGFEQNGWEHWDTIQRNAIRTWRTVHPEAQVILFGDDEPGAIQAADELDCSIYAIERNERGVPFVADAIRQAGRLAEHNVLCWVNADILLYSKFADAVKIVADRFEDFLMVTRRQNIDCVNKLGQDWERQIPAIVDKRGEVAIQTAMDVFFYRGDWLRDAPPFAVGRAAWDNWILWNALDQGIPTVDAQRYACCVHQNHPINRSRNEIKQNRRVLKKATGATITKGLRQAEWQLEASGEITKR